MVDGPPDWTDTADLDPDGLQPTSAGLATDPDRRTTSPLAPFAGGGWGPYSRFELIGRGGMGVVFRAYDSTLDRTVAVKLLRAGSPELAERFFREARAQARVRHDSVCAVYEAGTVDRTPYIVMQYIEGESLARAARSMTVAQRVRVLAQVADAVHAAHRIGLIHRDVKPGNVMVETTSDGELHPYVLDFGLVRDESAPGETCDGEVMGTPAYMAPEQVLGDLASLDRRTDVYSLGAVLYELLAGQPPFPGVAHVAQMLRTLEQEPVPPRRVDPAIPVDLETIVLKCLEKSPKACYQSARALADDLERFLDGEPIEARPQPPLVRLRRRLRTHRALVTAAAVALLSLLGAAHRLRGWFEWARGLDPAASWGAVLAAYERAVELEPRSAMVRASLADVYATRASYAVGHGRDPSDDLAAAVDAYRRSIDDNPNDAGAHSGLGTVHFTRAEADLAQGRDPRPAVTAAAESFARAAAITPRDDYPPFGHGYALLLQAEWELEHGADPRPALERAQASLEASRGLNPRNAFAAVQLANATRLLAASDLTLGAPAAASSVEAAVVGAHHAVSLDSTLSDAHLALGRALLLAAEWRERRGLDPEVRLAAAVEAFTNVAAVNPGDARAHAALASAIARRATLAREDAGSRAALVRVGLAAAERALAVNPRSREALEAERRLRLLAR